MLNTISHAHEFRTRAALEVLTWPGVTSDRLNAVVTARNGGVSTGPYESLNLGLHVGDDPKAVLENRRRAAAAVDLELSDLVFCNQAHGHTVAKVSASDRGRGATTLDDAIEAADALVTTDSGVGLVVMVADCVPLVMHDSVAGVLCCVHAGWRGTVAGVAEAAIDAMVELGSKPERIDVGVGPAIARTNYQVGNDVHEAALLRFGDRADEVVVPDGTGRWLFDCWMGNVITLLDSGIRSDRVHVAYIPTSDPRFFSDRAHRPCGRFAAIACMLD